MRAVLSVALLVVLFEEQALLSALVLLVVLFEEQAVAVSYQSERLW